MGIHKKTFQRSVMKLFGLAPAFVSASHSIGATFYTGSYLRGVSISIAAQDPNPENGSPRVKVKQTYSFRSDLAGFGHDGCKQYQVGKQSKRIGPVDDLNTAKYHRIGTFFQPEKAADLAELMNHYGPQDHWSHRLGDAKEQIDWKFNYKLESLKIDAPDTFDNWCMGSVEDVIESNTDVENPTSFLFRNRYEGGTSWMVLVADKDYRIISGNNRFNGVRYEKYHWGAAMFDVNPRSDTGSMNNSPVAVIPGEFLMPAGCVSSVQVPVSDPDGDTIKCRWATEHETDQYVSRNREYRDAPTGKDENGTWIYPNPTILVTDYPSITLDEETCTVTYDGKLDEICVTGTELFEHKSSSGKSMTHAGNNHCHKPFALMVEDFDGEGNVLSSVPAIFFGRVTKPEAGHCPGTEASIDGSISKAAWVALFSRVVVEVPADTGTIGVKVAKVRANKIKIAATYLDRVSLKGCTWMPVPETVIAFKLSTTIEELTTTGTAVIDETLKDCSDALKVKSATKWAKNMNNLAKIQNKIIKKYNDFYDLGF